MELGQVDIGLASLLVVVQSHSLQGPRAAWGSLPAAACRAAGLFFHNALHKTPQFPNLRGFSAALFLFLIFQNTPKTKVGSNENKKPTTGLIPSPVPNVTVDPAAPHPAAGRPAPGRSLFGAVKAWKLKPWDGRIILSGHYAPSFNLQACFTSAAHVCRPSARPRQRADRGLRKQGSLSQTANLGPVRAVGSLSSIQAHHGALSHHPRSSD